MPILLAPPELGPATVVDEVVGGAVSLAWNECPEGLEFPLRGERGQAVDNGWAHQAGRLSSHVLLAAPHRSFHHDSSHHYASHHHSSHHCSPEGGGS